MPQPQDRRCALENIKGQQYDNPRLEMRGGRKKRAETRDRTGDLQIFSLTLSQLSYLGWKQNLGPHGSATSSSRHLAFSIAT